jgi:hypothetical protein
MPIFSPQNRQKSAKIVIITSAPGPSDVPSTVRIDRPAMTQQDFHAAFKLVPRKTGISGVNRIWKHQKVRFYPDLEAADSKIYPGDDFGNFFVENCNFD